MKKMNRIAALSLLAALCLGLSACATTPLTARQIEEQRQDVRDMAKTTMTKLYQTYPEARAEVQKAAGYGVFSNFGFKFIFMGSANGEGVVINERTKKETFMKMFELSPGLGLGAQKFGCVFLFATQEALNSFVNSGWEFGGNTAAALQTSTQGVGGRMGVNVSPGVTMYQLSETGAIVGISITGAKYYKDDQLN